MRRAKQWAIIMMVFTVVFSMFGGTALGASTRFALVTGVTGTVKVTKAGGTKEIQVFNGMGLNEGDKLKVGKDSSLTLKVADRDDEVVLGANWNGTLSKLKEKAGGTDTAVKTWAGSMYSKVEKITGSNSTYKVETPTAVMGVRGTHFMVSIDPITGLPKMFVSAGKVAANSPGEPEEDEAMVLPAQQITLYPDAPPESGIEYVDPESLVENASPDVIAAIIKNKTLIDAENEELLGEDLGEEEGTLDLSEQDALDKYKANVDNALFNLLKSAVESGSLDEDEAEEIIEAANQGIQDAGKKFDLNRPVTPIDKTAGVDPAAQQQREQLKQVAEQKKQEQVQQKEEKKQEITTNNASVIQQIVQAAQELQQANQQAQQQKQQEATERLLNQLTEQQRQALQQRVEQKKEEAKQQQQQPQQQPDTGTGGETTTTATTTTVQVSKSESVVGEALTITATVKNNSTNAAVPNGTTVTFRKGTTSIGTATTTDGKAVLTISQSQSASVFPMGTYSVNALYAGTSSLQSSESESVALKVKSNTNVEITGPTSSAVGATFTLNINVTAVSPGSGTPAGTVELYDSSLKIGEKTLSSAGATFFELTPNATAATTKTYKAVYKPSTAALYVTSEKVHTHNVVVPTPSSPTMTLQKTTTTEGFDIAVKLDNFTGTKKLQGMQIHFVSERSVEPLELLTGQTHYNASKFTNATQTVEVFKYVDGLVAEQPRRESIYTMTVFGTGTPVEFDGNETMATLKFDITSMDEIPDNIQYVYAQFVFEDGTSYVPNVTYNWNY